jgi:WD40 repeat protein
MAKAAGFSATTLSQAAAGERLPSLDVLRGYVCACGGDPEEWGPRWKEAEAELAQAAAGEEPEGPAPYRGLARFEPADQHLFFGRDRMIDAVGELVCERRFAVLFGPSGSGKSSLLRAGLIPRLQREISSRGVPATLRILTPGMTPAATYGPLLAPREEENWVVVDQFEEVFTLCRDPRERSRFIDLLLAARAPESKLRVLIALRADFYARCAEHRDLAEAVSGAGLLLGPMTADELREAVVGPAQAAGYLVERSLTARLVEEVLDEPGGLPMLSHVLLETWRRRKGRMLTLAGYQAADGVRGAIAATAEKVYGGLSQAQARTARHLMLRMVEPGQGSPDTRRPLTRTELNAWADPDVPLVVERLTRARLLTADKDEVQFAHEALITCWPRLHRWIERDRERLRHHRMLADAARTWLDHDRDPGALYRGTRLARAEELFPDCTTDPALTATEQTFLAAALETREAERRVATRSSRRHRILSVSLSAVLAVAVLTAFTVWRQYEDNQRQRTQSAARRVADVADALRTTDPHTALLLGAAAWQLAKLPETRRALLGSLAQRETDTFTDPAPGDGPTRLLADGGRVLLNTDGSNWRTWDVTTHRRIGLGRVPEGTLTETGPDARVVEVVQNVGVRLWDTAKARWTTGILRDISDIHYSGDGRAFFAAEGDRVRLRSVADGHVLFDTRAPTAGLTAVSTDGRTVAACSGESPQLWDATSSRVLTGAWQRDRVCDQETPILTLGGTELAAATGTGLRVWDTATGQRIADLYDPGVQYASFSRNGAFLATADREEIRVWRLDALGAPVFRHDLNNQRLYEGPLWDRDGHTLRYLEGGTVHTLDLGAAVTSAWHSHPVDDVRIAPDGRTYATVERIGDRYVFRLRASADGHILREFPSDTVPASAHPTPPTVPGDTRALLAFSPDSTRFAYGVSALVREVTTQRITVVDVARGRFVSSLDLPGQAVFDMVLGPDARTLAIARSTSAGGVADEVWDIARHRRMAKLAGVTGSHLAVRPDSGLMTGAGQTARLPSGRTIQQDLVQGDEIGALAFTADSSLLAVGDQTGRVALWDGDLRHNVGVLRNVFPGLLGTAPEGVSAVAFSPDGQTLAVGGDGGSLQLWDVATRQPLGSSLTTPGEAIEDLAFASDSTAVYVGSAHVPLQRYAVEPGQAVTRVCARARGVGLTRAQWLTYVPEAPYRRVCD